MFDFESKYFVDVVYIFLFLCIQQPSNFNLIYYFPNNLHNWNSQDFSKSDKNIIFSLIGKPSSS